ncbi:MAG: ribosome maturation factor RimP [Ignavibacteria bacterium]|nr:MAG: ribosome maturation factor RimP [Ignavibacteria bacterium]
MPLPERIEEIARPVVESHDAYIIDVKVRGESGAKIAELFVDTDEGVTTGLCERISKELSGVLDAAELFRGRYHLVVSSPGVERPLRFPRQFPRNVGRTLKVKIRSGDAVENVEGTLAGSTGEEIQLGLTGENLRTIPYRDIIEARVIADISNKPLR